MRSVWVVFLLFLIPLAGRLEAQRLAQPAFPSSFPSIQRAAGEHAAAQAAVLGRSVPMLDQGTRRPTAAAWLVAGGLLGAATVGFGGAWSGARLTEDDCEDCALVGAAYGAVAGASAGIPLGVHLANGARGNLLKSTAASLVIGGVGLAIAHLTHEEGVMFGVPVLQLVSSVAIERKTRR